MRNYPLLVQKYGGTSIGTAERMLSVVNIVKLNNKMFVLFSHDHLLEFLT